MKKALIITISISLVLILLIGTGIWYWQKTKIDNQKTTLEKQKEDLEKKIQELESKKESASDKTANWKIYDHKNFSIKYPKNWITTELDQVIFHPEGTVVNYHEKNADVLFWVWVSPSSHVDLCYFETANKTNVTYNDFKGTRTECPGEVIFIFTEAPDDTIIERGEGGYLEIRFVFQDGNNDLDLVNDVMSTLDIK